LTESYLLAPDSSTRGKSGCFYRYGISLPAVQYSDELSYMKGVDGDTVAGEMVTVLKLGSRTPYLRTVPQQTNFLIWINLLQSAGNNIKSIRKSWCEVLIHQWCITFRHSVYVPWEEVGAGKRIVDS
jgi:hypothetical protein